MALPLAIGHEGTAQIEPTLDVVRRARPFGRAYQAVFDPDRKDTVADRESMSRPIARPRNDLVPTDRLLRNIARHIRRADLDRILLREIQPKRRLDREALRLILRPDANALAREGGGQARGKCEPRASRFDSK